MTQNLGLTHATFDTTVERPTRRREPNYSMFRMLRESSIFSTKPLNANYNFNARATYYYVGPMQDITYARNNLAGYSLLNARFGLVRDVFSASCTS